MNAERRVTLKSRAQIERMAAAGQLVADVLDRVGREIRPGVATIELDRLAEEHIRSAGAIVDGWHGDAARTWILGEVPEATRRLVETTERAMYAGIAAAVAGSHLSDISGAIEDVATTAGYGIVRAFVGHGIGTEMHEEPQLTNYRSGARGRRLEPGLCLAIEPMFTLASHEVRVRDDGWTVVTADGSLAAHWEHTIAITEEGPRILTAGTAGARLGRADERVPA